MRFCVPDWSSHDLQSCGEPWQNSILASSSWDEKTLATLAVTVFVGTDILQVFPFIWPVQRCHSLNLYRESVGVPFSWREVPPLKILVQVGGQENCSFGVVTSIFPAPPMLEAKLDGQGQLRLRAEQPSRLHLAFVFHLR